MKNFTLFLFCIIAVFFQLSVVGVFFAAHRIPDLALAFVITLVLTLGFKESLKWILLAGLLVDAGSGEVFGTTILAYFLLGWVISWIADVADLRSRKAFFLAALAALVVVSEIVKDLLVLFSLKIRASYLHEQAGFSMNIFSLDYFFKIVYTMLAAFAVYYIFRKLSRALFAEPVRLMKKY